MHISVIAVGRAKGSPEEALVEDYRHRLIALGRRIGIEGATVTEIEDRKGGSGRKEREGELILARVPQGALMVALDEHAGEITSAEFAERLKSSLGSGTRHLAFAIGGADGLSQEVLDHAKLKLAFGRTTWPHLLVRAMLFEQLYRAATILTHHPYHRG